MKFQDPPARTDFKGKTWQSDGVPSWYWLQYFFAISNRISVPIISDQPPATSAAPGIAGQIAFDANFLYVAVATNNWRRVALAVF